MVRTVSSALKFRLRISKHSIIRWLVRKTAERADAMQNKEPALVHFVLSRPPAASCRHLQPPKPGQKSTQKAHDACSHHAPCQFLIHTASFTGRMMASNCPATSISHPYSSVFSTAPTWAPSRDPKADEGLCFVLPLAVDGHVSRAELAAPRILSAYPVSLNCPWTALQQTSN